MKNRSSHSLRRCRSGATAIEFAIIAPILFLLLIGMVETSLIFMTDNALEAATSIGSRTGRIGYTQGTIPRENYIKNQIYHMSGGFLDQRRLKIFITSYKNFSDIGQPHQGVSSAGNEDQVVFYKVTYSWPLFTPLMKSFLGDRQGNIQLGALATVRNEDF